VSKQLISQQERLVREDLSDQYLAISYAVEQSLLAAGAVPGEDYTILDLYKLAQPFVLEIMKNGDEVQHLNIVYPAKKVDSQKNMSP